MISRNLNFSAEISTQNEPEEKLENLYQHFLHLKKHKETWESLWNECYEYALPQKRVFGDFGDYKQKNNNLYDATAADAVDQLASSMFAELTPPWSKWFGLASGIQTKNHEKEIGEKLSNSEEIIKYHFDNSNFFTEIHQCYLDLVTLGTASLLFEEGKIGETSAFKFTAIPLCELYIDETEGRLNTTFRMSKANLDTIKSRFATAVLPLDFVEEASKDKEYKATIIESVCPQEKGGYWYTAFISEDSSGYFGSSNRFLLKEGFFEHSPFINFRWQKIPSEIYGRSPVMKALPDIKTANKVVELILKNASLAVTGIWQAEDDGVLNPANIKLVPGTIIPKAVGSKGLTPLESAGNFDISQLVLNDLRSRIKHAMLIDRLGQIIAPNMTATEVLERSSEMARILGATYGRLQSELLTPLITRGIAILVRRGEISPLFVDGRFTRLTYASPLAKKQAQSDAANVLSWLSSVNKMGTLAMSSVDIVATSKWLGRTLNVPEELINSQTVNLADMLQNLSTNLKDDINISKA